MTFYGDSVQYLHLAGDSLNCRGPLSQSMPAAVLEEVNKEVSKAAARGKKCVAYCSFSPEQRAKVASTLA